MSWSEQPPQVRAARKQRRAARRRRTSQNTTEFWDEKEVTARTPADKASHEWDLARRNIAKLRDRAKQDAAYADLEAAIAEFNKRSTKGPGQ